MQLFIDTNIYLNYLKMEDDYPKNFFIQLDELINSKKIQLIVTDQIIDEYNRNVVVAKEKKIREISNSIDNILKNDDKIFSDNFLTFNKKTKKFLKRCKSQFDKQKTKINEVRIEFKKREEILNVFFKKYNNIIKSDYEILKAAECRYLKGNPPRKEKEKSESFGDAINWELILKFCKKGDSLIILSEDGDYSDNKKTIDSFLKKEWAREHRGTIQLYRGLGVFLNKYSKKPVIDEEIIKRAESVRRYQALDKLRSYVKNAVAQLNPVEQKVLEMRFGLVDGVTHTLEEVGQEFEVSREDISKIESVALEKIRKLDVAEGNY